MRPLRFKLMNRICFNCTLIAPVRTLPNLSLSSCIFDQFISNTGVWRQHRTKYWLCCACQARKWVDSRPSRTKLTWHQVNVTVHR